MSFSSVVKGLPPSTSVKPRSGPPSPHPIKKVNDLGFLDPVIVGSDARGSIHAKRFESVTQTLTIEEALPFSRQVLFLIGNTMKLRMSDNKSAMEYCALDILDKMIQVRPGEGHNGIDIVIFLNKSYNLSYFHMHLYFDMSVRFRQVLKKDEKQSDLIEKYNIRSTQEKERSDIKGLLLSGMSIEDIYDKEAIANITGSPSKKDKDI